MKPYHVILFLFLFGSLAVRSMDRYVVSMPDAAMRLVHVQASIHLGEEGLLMSPFGAEHLVFGWATFVYDLKATTTDGEVLNIERSTGGGFQLEYTGTVQLEYTVRIDHENEPWPFGHKEAAYVRGDMLMATGNALFITRLDLDSAQVSFEIPGHYRVASAWRGTARNEYMVVGAEEFVWTVLLIGVFEQQEFQVGDMRLVLANGSGIAGSSEQIIDITRRSIDGYMNYYGGPPRTRSSSETTYLMVINVDTTYEGGGAAFTNSISIMLGTRPDGCDTISTHCWHHIVVHELGHLWNGYSLLTEEVDQWFREGFTNYLAFRLQWEIGLYTEEQWRAFLVLKEKNAQDARAGSKVSLADAGNDKAANYELIYAGGFHFAQQLDSTIATATDGDHDLLDVLKRLYITHAGSAKFVDQAALKHASMEVCSCELEESLFHLLIR